MSASSGVAQLLSEARELLKQGEIQSALTKAREAVGLAPVSAEVRFVLGLALARSGNYTEATDAFHAAVIASPTSLSAQQNLALSAERAGRWDVAYTAWHAVVGIDPSNAQAAAGILRAEPHRTPEEEDEADGPGFADGEDYVPPRGPHINASAPWEIVSEPPRPPTPPPPRTHR